MNARRRVKEPKTTSAGDEVKKLPVLLRDLLLQFIVYLYAMTAGKKKREDTTGKEGW